MKWIGKTRIQAGEWSIEYQNGQMYIDYLAVIEKDNEGIFHPHLYKVYLNGELSDDEIPSLWSTSLASAKKRLGMDSDLRAKDFVWEVVNE